MSPMELIILIVIALPFVFIYYYTQKKIKIFKVYEHKTKGYAAVKDGVAWLAPPLNPLWFLYRGLWFLFFTYIILILIAVEVDIELYGDLDVMFINYASDKDWIWFGIQIIVFFLLPFIKGNDWTATNLVKKGYLLQDSVAAATKKNAISIVQDNKTNSSYGENEMFFKKSKKSKKTDDKFKVLTHLNDKDELSAIRYTADIGNAKSQYILALMYYSGKDVPLNFEESVHWARKAANQDFPEAQMFMAARYFDGKGVDIDEETGKDWLELAAQSSDSKISKMAKKELEDFRISKKILKNIDPQFLK